MQKQMVLAGKTIVYDLRTHARARRVILRPGDNGAIIVVKPKRVSLWRIELFLRARAVYIVKQMALWEFQHTQKISWGPLPSFVQGKQEALGIIEQRLAELNIIYGFTYKTVRVKNQKTRWGSCSKKGAINVNYRVAYLPPALADYILVHELCHLEAMNHSPRFWSLVARVVPEYRERRRELRGYALTN